MGYHEQLPQDSPLHKESSIELPPKPEIVLIADNRVQVALMDVWNEGKIEGERIPHSELALAWIEEGYAEKYRAYAENAPEKQIDIHDEDALLEILAELDTDKEALH